MFWPVLGALEFPIAALIATALGLSELGVAPGLGIAALTVTASGVPADTTFHDLGHHYASLLIRYGESVKVVQARLGHSSAAELDTYSHLWPDSEDPDSRRRRLGLAPSRGLSPDRIGALNAKVLASVA